MTPRIQLPLVLLFGALLFTSCIQAAPFEGDVADVGVDAPTPDDTSGGDTVSPDASEPDVTEPDAAEPDATEPEDDGGPNVLAWSTLGASAAVGVTSLITGVVGHGIAQDLDEDCPGGVCPPTTNYYRMPSTTTTTPVYNPPVTNNYSRPVVQPVGGSNGAPSPFYN